MNREQILYLRRYLGLSEAQAQAIAVLVWGGADFGLRQSSLPDDFRNELARLVRAGFPLLPLGGGADGKGPMVGAWTGPKLALARVLAPLYRCGSQVYGIRLYGLAVIDCDSDSTELVAALEARFGPSPVHVSTPRGRHLHFRATAKAPNLRAEGLPVDIKSGSRAFVAGPWSVRPDGGCYRPAKGLLGVDPLPALRASVAPQNRALSAPIPVGHRHSALIREAMQMLELVDSAGELAGNLAAVRDDLCEDAATLPDSELRAIAGWAWQARLDNRIYRGRDSALSVHRLALDALRQWDNEAAPDTAAEPDTAPKARTQREGTKQAKLIAMLRAPDGATIEEIMVALEWAAHTIRGAMAGALKKKLGLEVTSEKVEGRGRVYAIR